MSWFRKMQGKAARMKETLLEHAYLITLGAVVAVVAASAMYTSRVQQQNAPQVEAAAGAPEIGETTAASEPPAVTPLPTLAPLAVRQTALVSGGGRVWPVSGTVIRGYAPNEPVLWAALSCMQAHAAVDIAGQAGEDVLCVMDGVVEQVSQNALWGWQVCISQTDGSTALYAGLGTCDLAQGQAITRGQTLGTLMEAIPSEAELGAHLHFSVEREGAPEDPDTLLRNAQRR